MSTTEQIEKMTEPSLPDLDQLLSDVARKTTEDTINFPARFNFIWHNIPFAGQILHSKNNDGEFSLNLIANLGYIPFSSENFSQRKKLLKIFTPHFMKGDYRLSSNSQIQMILLTHFDGPVNAKRLVEVITYTLLDQNSELKSIQASIIA